MAAAVDAVFARLLAKLSEKPRFIIVSGRHSIFDYLSDSNKQPRGSILSGGDCDDVGKRHYQNS